MHPRVTLSVGNFFFSIFSSLVGIILLPYLSAFMPTAYAGFVVALGAVGAVALFPFLPRVVERYGAQQIALIFSLAEMVVLFALATVPGAVAGILLMAVAMAIQPFLSYEFDLLLEATIVDENTTGRVRAVFRTAYNTAALAAPLLLGALLANSNDYGRVGVDRRTGRVARCISDSRSGPRRTYRDRHARVGPDQVHRSKRFGEGGGCV